MSTFIRFFDFVVVGLVVWSTEGVASNAESTWATIGALLGPLASISGAIVGQWRSQEGRGGGKGGCLPLEFWKCEEMHGANSKSQFYNSPLNE